jgi:PTH1 family peptidyl-tRNA hydrolase
MGLFQKREDSISPPLYSLGLNRTVLIAGLGNPGKEYDGTRHNIGFAAIDQLADKQDFDAWVGKKDLKSLITTKTLGNSRVILMRPTTFMNLSGEAVRAVMDFYKVPLQQVIVVHDELDIPFGQIRTRMGGVKSVTQHLGEPYGRVRIGIGPKEPEQIDSADFVLAKFSKEQQADMPALIKEAQAVLTEYIYGDSLAAETRNFII